MPPFTIMGRFNVSIYDNICSHCGCVLLGLLCWLFVAQASAQSVYERATPRTPQESSTCMNGDEGMSSFVNRKFQENRTQVLESRDGDPNWDMRDPQTTSPYSETINPDGSCTGTMTGRARLYRCFTATNCQAQQQYVNYYANGVGTVVISYNCPDTNYPDATYKHIDDNGASSCYDPADLAFNSDCPTDHIIPTQAGTTGNICHIKDDGSACLLTAATVGGQSFYVQSAEPSTCYGSALPDANAIDVNGAVGDQCQDIGGGVSACPETPANVCDAQGVCQTGCGYVGTLDGQQFLCLSGDTDSDGIGDYKDPDIDGDGILNEEDDDADGDGVPDENGDGNGNSNGNGNGGTGGGTGVGDITVEVDNSDVVAAVNRVNQSLNEDFTPYQGATSLMDDLFNQEAIDAVIANATTKKNEMSTYMEQIKGEMAAIFDVPEITDTYQARQLSLTFGNFDISLNRFASDFINIGNAVIFAATILAMLILIRKT